MLLLLRELQSSIGCITTIFLINEVVPGQHASIGGRQESYSRPWMLVSIACCPIAVAVYWQHSWAMTGAAAVFGIAASAAAHLTTQVQSCSIANELQVERFDDLIRSLALCSIQASWQLAGLLEGVIGCSE